MLGCVLGTLVVIGQHGQTDTALLRLTAECLVRRRTVQPQQEMQARILLGDGGIGGQRALMHGGDDGVTLLAVVLTHTAQVLFIPAAGEELGQGVLLEGGDGAGVKAQLLPEVRQQAAGQDHEADTDRGGDGLGKGVKIDHLLAAVDGEQGGDGTAYKAEFAVVIVLQDDPRRDLLCPAQQLLAAGDGHHQTGGIVVAG